MGKIRNQNYYNFKTDSKMPDWWDGVCFTNNAFYYSSSMWASFYNVLGGSVDFYHFYKGLKFIALVQIYKNVIGIENYSFLPFFALRILNRIKSINSSRFHLQPVFTTSLKNEAHKLEIVDYIVKTLLKHNKCILPSDLIFSKDRIIAEKIVKKYKNNSFLIGTVRLSLFSDIDLMYKSFNESVKSGIRKCQKYNVTVEEINLKDLRLFYDNLKLSWRENSLHMPSFEYYKKMFMNCSNVKFYIAIYQKTVVAGAGVMFFGETAVEFSMFSTPFSHDQKIPGGDLLKWNIIQESIRRNIKVFDFNMISIPKKGIDMDEKLQKINFYKIKWGGEIIYGCTIYKWNTFIKLLRFLKLHILGH